MQKKIVAATEDQQIFSFLNIMSSCLNTGSTDTLNQVQAGFRGELAKRWWKLDAKLIEIINKPTPVWADADIELLTDFVTREFEQYKVSKTL